MLPLYLLAAHMIGDFVLQTRWQAAGKLTDSRLRRRHVLVYCVPFVPIALAYGGFDPDAPWVVNEATGRVWGALVFLGWLAFMHYLTDSRRFRSTLGDVIAWRVAARRDPTVAVTTWLDYLYGDRVPGVMPNARLPLDERARAVENITSGGRLRFPPPNPWGSAPILIDQSLHVAQVAVLAGMFLR